MATINPDSGPPTVAEGLFSFQVGGSERVGADVALGFAERGYRVVAFAFYGTDGPIRRELERQGIECLDLNYETRWRPVRRITYQLELAVMLRRHRVAALHVHHATALIIGGWGPRWFGGVRRIVMTEHALHQLIDREKYRKQARATCGRYAHEVTIVHPGMHDYFANELAVPAEHIHFVPNGVRKVPELAPEARRALRAEAGVPDDAFLFIAVGRLHYTKDFGTLLAAVATMPAEERARLRVWIVGGGGERESLEAQHASLGLGDTVRFLGERSDVRVLLRAADAFVMSSVTEGLPMALLEALSTGLPSVATSVGGIPGVLGSGAGLLAPPSAPESLAQQMLRVRRDSNLRRELSAAALARASSDYSMDSVITRYLELLGLPPEWKGARPLATERTHRAAG